MRCRRLSKPSKATSETGRAPLGRFLYFGRISNDTCFIAQCSPEYTSQNQRRSSMARSIRASFCREGGGSPTCATSLRASKAFSISPINFLGSVIGRPSAHLALTGRVGTNLRSIFPTGGVCNSSTSHFASGMRVPINPLTATSAAETPMTRALRGFTANWFHASRNTCRASGSWAPASTLWTTSWVCAFFAKMACVASPMESPIVLASEYCNQRSPSSEYRA